MPNSYTGALVAVRDVKSLRRRIQSWRQEGCSVALVPTMGALHQGHMKLMENAKKLADRVIATIFVNPKQFGPKEDLAAYPRRESEDFEMLNASGVHLLFAPSAEEMYPEGYATSVHVGGISTILDGAHRTGHFDGVATVVTKLMLQSLPDIALFGEKDYQQLVTIRRFVADLNIPVDVIGVPTVRERDGLAMSSRNTYLTEEERRAAPTLFAEITKAAREIAGGSEIVPTLQAAKEAILNSGFKSVDYVEARYADTLNSYENRNKPGRVLAAAHLGKARLIDNVPIQP